MIMVPILPKDFGSVAGETGTGEWTFDVDHYCEDNLAGIESWFRRKEREQFWEFFDPDDLANLVLSLLNDYVLVNPNSRHDERLIQRTMRTIRKRVWIHEIRRERAWKNLADGDVVPVPYRNIDLELVADVRFDRAQSMRDAVADAMNGMSQLQQSILIKRLENRKIEEIAKQLGISKSTVEREFAIVKRIAKATSNEQQTRRQD